MPVGDKQGNIYQNRQGTGLATILGKENTSPYLDQALKAIPKKKTPEQRQADLMKKMNASKPEWWWKHNDELDVQFNDLLNYGAKLMEAGVDDPFAATGKEARAFQQGLLDLENSAQLSKQLEGQYEADRKKYNPEKHSLESGERNYNFYDQNSLNDIKDQGMLPPMFEFKEPDFELAKYYGNLAKNLGVSNKDPDVDDFDLAIQQALNDPAASDFGVALNQTIQNLTPDELQSLKDQATAAGKTPQEILGRNQLESYFKTEPLNVDDIVDDIFPGYETISKDFENKEGVTSKSMIKRVLPKKAKAAAKLALKQYPKLLKQLTDGGMATDEASAAQFLVDKINAKADYQKKTGLSRESKWGYGGMGKYSSKEVEKDHDIWDQVMRADLTDWKGRELTPELRQVLQDAAAQYLVGTKIDGYEVVAKGDDLTGSTRIQYENIPGGTAVGGSVSAEDGGGELIRTGDVNIVLRKPKKKRTKFGDETTTEDLDDFSTKKFAVTQDRITGDAPYLSESTSQKYYDGGLRKQRELFSTLIDRAIADYDENLSLQGSLGGDEITIEQEQDPVSDDGSGTSGGGDFDDF